MHVALSCLFSQHVFVILIFCEGNVSSLRAVVLPKWLIKAIDKKRRSFLWSGEESVQGGKCLVAWSMVFCPIAWWARRVGSSDNGVCFKTKMVVVETDRQHSNLVKYFHAARKTSSSHV